MKTIELTTRAGALADADAELEMTAAVNEAEIRPTSKSPFLIPQEGAESQIALGGLLLSSQKRKRAHAERDH